MPHLSFRKVQYMHIFPINCCLERECPSPNTSWFWKALASTESQMWCEWKVVGLKKDKALYMSHLNFNKKHVQERNSIRQTISLLAENHVHHALTWLYCNIRYVILGWFCSMVSQEWHQIHPPLKARGPFHTSEVVLHTSGTGKEG